MFSLISEPKYLVAQWLWEFVYFILKPFGLQSSINTQAILYVVCVILLALAIGYALRRIILLTTVKLKIFDKTALGERIKKLHTLESCTLFIAPSVFLCLGSFAFDDGDTFLLILQKVVTVYLIITLAIAVCAILKLEWNIVDAKYNTKNLPLDGVYNMGCGIVWIIAVILSASTLMDKSPVSLLAGLGAVSAALLLIFRDSILGLVATLQLSSNDMVRKGDWIVVDGTSINGSVLQVTLTAVKVLNWDNTTSLISPYKLVSGSFQNYRSMFEIGARQIQSSIYIDPCTVKSTTKELFDKIAKQFPIMAKAISAATSENGLALTQDPLQSGMATNLGLFRAYLFAYLKQHPKIAQDQYLLVDLQNETEFGIPLQIYCYSNNTSWVPYEQIHDEVLEHVFAMAPEFDLGLCNFSNYSNAVTLTNPMFQGQPAEQIKAFPGSAKVN